MSVGSECGMTLPRGVHLTVNNIVINATFNVTKMAHLKNQADLNGRCTDSDAEETVTWYKDLN